MTLDPQIAGLIESLDSGFPPVHTMTGAQARAAIRARFVANPDPEPVASVTDHQVAVDNGRIDVRVYRPDSSEPLPMLVFAHGGGFVFCDLDSHDGLCRAMANGLGAVVVSVDYRLAPEARWPAAADDVYAATAWAARNAEQWGADPGRLVIAGDSAGGNLAAVVAMLARDRGGPKIALQVLIYPVVDQRRKSSTASEHAKNGVLTGSHMQWFTEQYLGREGDRSNVLASPILGEFAGLPPAHVVTGALDPLCEEGEDFAGRLRGAGVPATVRRYDEGFHGFFNLADHLPLAREANEDVCVVLRNALGNKTSDHLSQT